MERLNGTIRDREKTFRGLGCYDTAVFDGMKVHYNHVRRHDSIGKTPAEAAGITIEGRNKWKTIIQNSSLHLIATNQRVRARGCHEFAPVPEDVCPYTAARRAPGTTMPIVGAVETERPHGAAAPPLFTTGGTTPMNKEAARHAIRECGRREK